MKNIIATFIIGVCFGLLMVMCLNGMAEQSANDSSRYAQEYREFLKQVEQEQGQYIAPADQVFIDIVNYEE